MTKLWIVSDLHMEFGGPWIDPPADADIAVIAGDVCDDHFLAHVASKLPTVFVAGNHDYYGMVMHERKSRLASIPGLTFLERQSAEIGGIDFFGCTLWTSYADGDRDVMRACGAGLADHRFIRANASGELFDPRAAYGIHVSSVYAISDFFADRAVAGRQNPLVIVTHHAPSPRSIHPRFFGSPLNAAFVSDLDDLVAMSGAAIWNHGHVHDPQDYAIGETRVICNPRGYPSEAGNGFNPGLLVEV